MKQCEDCLATGSIRLWLYNGKKLCGDCVLDRLEGLIDNLGVEEVE